MLKIQLVTICYFLTPQHITGKNEEIVTAEGNSKGIDDQNRTITSDKLTYNKITNIVDAEGV